MLFLPSPRVLAGEGHPSDVKWMRKGTKRLRPNDAEEAKASVADLCEDTIEDISKKVHGKANHNSFATLVAKKSVLACGSRPGQGRLTSDRKHN